MGIWVLGLIRTLQLLPGWLVWLWRALRLGGSAQNAGTRWIFQAVTAKALRHSAYPIRIKTVENKVSNQKEEEGVRAFSESL